MWLSVVYPNLFHWDFGLTRHCDPNTDEFCIVRMSLNTDGSDTVYLGLSRRDIEFYRRAIL